MADLWNIISSNYLTVGGSTFTAGRYVDVDPEKFEGSWSGKYANNQAYEITVSQVSGFRAKVKYQSGTTVKYQDVLIKNDSFRIGDSKFVWARDGVAQIATVMTNPATGTSTLEKSYAHRT